MSYAPLITQIIFYVFALITIGSASMVVFSRNPMRSVLYLVMCFVASAVLWLLLQAEFLALVMIFVYVGAVMTLFLFVVMMLHVDLAPLKEGFVHYLPYAAFIMLALLAMLVLVFLPGRFPLEHLAIQQRAADYPNTEQLGQVLYTHYVLSFELAGAILLVAIISAISLAFFGRKPGTKSQKIAKQLLANKENRLTRLKLDASGLGEKRD